ncbi:hypothetical protein PAHAL_5G140700 [Panicum hallii]|jgi:hypothetical protein|uniref:Late embryogenesis abundant protein LEA-2 subgroup domain-containing protein n=1 Tax=Panicum hallii TaxID=206008 RepID=A0A2S3HR87_9POAL|nr:hypothetical protein PAHAL_5G140700 [Panicum hallii]
MCLGVDLEEAARPVDYDIFADPRDDEAPPVMGYRAPSCWSRLSDEDRLIGPPVLIATCLLMALLVGASIYVLFFNDVPSFAVGVAGYGGIDPGRPGRVVSPAFDVALRVNKACVDHAGVVVAYAGVALGWARAEPWDCEEKRWEKGVVVVARGAGVGLPEHLRDRMASEWRSGALELDVEVEIFDSSGSSRAAGDFPQKLMTCKVRLDAQNSEPLPCAWYALDPDVF